MKKILDYEIFDCKVYTILTHFAICIFFSCVLLSLSMVAANAATCTYPALNDGRNSGTGNNFQDACQNYTRGWDFLSVQSSRSCSFMTSYGEAFTVIFEVPVGCFDGHGFMNKGEGFCDPMVENCDDDGSGGNGDDSSSNPPFVAPDSPYVEQYPVTEDNYAPEMEFEYVDHEGGFDIDPWAAIRGFDISTNRINASTQCPNPPSFDFYGRVYTLETQTLCGHLGSLAPAILFCAYLAGAYIIIKE